ncbi:MAG: rod shape-determining protein [Lachnospiraceae bacterium]|nr:rod shape-determining protein [Lachnospiraceae bacterium]
MTHRGKVVFGLDIGTRSIVGTVGYKRGERFVVMAQRVREHETRAMLDGQIHDIRKVGNSISIVKEELEKDIGGKLTEVCIAAAGRVLRTVTTHVEAEYEGERVIKDEDIYALSAQGIEQAYNEFQASNDTDMKFFCVGYSVIRYFINNYPIGNPEEHKAHSMGADMIITFLPEDVVDGLYKSVELAGLEVANLTLEPIAAIQVAIPEKYRMLNIALVDVGAGTSDISITRDGAIEAYGMIPIAGDSLTEVIAQHCLVDFNTAEQIKRQAEVQEEITYADIMGLSQTISKEEVLNVLKPAIENMTKPVADCIRELNGDKPVSAVFVVGGGGRVSGYTDMLAEELGIVKERVALRGKEVMGTIDFPEGIEKSSLLVTPVGICLNYYEQSNNFIFVSFNGTRIKVYDNGRLSVVDAAMQADFPNDGLFPKRGKELNYTVDGKVRMKRGELGEAAVITVNGEQGDIHTPIKANDVIQVTSSTEGEPAKLEIRNLPEFEQYIRVNVNDKKVNLPKFAQVNGALQSGYYEIKEGDTIQMLDYYTVSQILEFLDVILPKDTPIAVNNMLAGKDTPVYENFTMVWGEAAESIVQLQAASVAEPESLYEESGDTLTYDEESEEESAADTVEDTVNESAETDTVEKKVIPRSIVVTANGMPITLTGKASYVYVDIFEYIDFDTKTPQGSIVTLLNGEPAEYLKELKSGDDIEVYWKN